MSQMASIVFEGLPVLTPTKFQEVFPADVVLILYKCSILDWKAEGVRHGGFEQKGVQTCSHEVQQNWVCVRFRCCFGKTLYSSFRLKIGLKLSIWIKP